MASAAPVLQKAFQAQREFLRIASKSKQPEPGTLASLLKPTGDSIDEIQAFREKMRRLARTIYQRFSVIISKYFS